VTAPICDLQGQVGLPSTATTRWTAQGTDNSGQVARAFSSSAS
jgi:hypothetical protein